MKKIILGLIALSSISAFAEVPIPANSLDSYKEAVAMKIDDTPCNAQAQNGYFSLDGYGGHSFDGQKGNTFPFSSLIKSASNATINKTPNGAVITFYTVTGLQTLVTSVTTTGSEKEISNYEIAELFPKEMNLGTLADPKIITKLTPSGTTWICNH